MVYEFVNTGYAFPPDIFAGIFSRDFTHPLLAAISVTAVAVFWLNLSRDPTATARSPLEPQAIWANPILVVGLSFVVLFLHFATDYAVSDEVMINLEHSYNLHHFGRFSMSPSAMVDGTVEYLVSTCFTRRSERPRGRCFSPTSSYRFWSAQRRWQCTTGFRRSGTPRFAR